MAFAGFALSDPLAGPGFVEEAASRVFLDVTAALRTSLGRQLLIQVMAQAEAHAAAIFEELAADPWLSLRPVARAKWLRTLVRLLIRTRLLWYLPQTLLTPARGCARLLAVEQTLHDTGQGEPDASPEACLGAVKALFDQTMPRLIPAVVPAMLGGMIAFSLAARLLGDRASRSDLQTVLRGLPSNPTTEMTLALWQLAQQVQADASAADFVRVTSTQQLAQAYLRGNLPTVLQSGLADFLRVYGHRSINELDLGEPRWSENPAYVLNLLASYLEVRNPAEAPDAQYQRAAQQAEVMVAELITRARQTGWLRGLLVGFFLRRARALGGLREMPRDALALLLAEARSLLHRVGQELVRAGVLANPSDIFFLSLKEAQAALSGTDFRPIVTARRQSYQQEQTRQHVPLVLLSDGTEPAVAPQSKMSTEGGLQGIPVSPGVVTASARVIFDPQGAQFSRGDILVAPSTDPGWTPLFLMAGGLVLETGGEMSHGAIVAREYGIPAIVGVAGATEQIRTGQFIQVDGATGVIRLDVDPS